MENLITVTKHFAGYEQEYPNRNLVEFSAFVDNQLASIPEDCQSSAQLSLKPVDIYGENCVDIIISYIRPETEDEKNVRLENQAKIQEVIRQKELKMLADLRQRYPDVV